MCQTARQDDLTIRNEERLFRRMSPFQIVEDEDTGRARFSSGAFRDKELSINVESVLLRGGEAADACLRKYQGYKLASFTAGQARQLQQIVCPDPSRLIICRTGWSAARRVASASMKACVFQLSGLFQPQAPRYDDIAHEKKQLGMSG